MSIDYDSLRGTGASAGGEPPDGTHKATLAVAKLVEVRSGATMLVTEWQTQGLTPYYWTTWFGFEPKRMSFTQEFLDFVGVDRSQITDDDKFAGALELVQGQSFTVRTAAWSGGINTYVEQSESAMQASLDDMPADTNGLPEVSTTVSPTVPDESIPF